VTWEIVAAFVITESLELFTVTVATTCRTSTQNTAFEIYRSTLGIVQILCLDNSKHCNTAGQQPYRDSNISLREPIAMRRDVSTGLLVLVNYQ